MKSFSITDVGMKRQINQDYLYRSETPVGRLPNLFLVADGMGGHKAGDYASHCCVDTIVDSIQNSGVKTAVGILEEAIARANETIFKKAASDQEYEGMGTTVVAATVMDSGMYVANVGDSRLYVITEGIRQITQDHSLVEEMVRNGEIKRREARTHPNKNIITRAVGTGKYVAPDYFEVPVRAGDIVLLCSDGLTNMVEDEEILKIVKENGERLDKMGDSLIETANRHGGKDNIAVVLIEIT